jgi:AcrR family transcriptional regulator
MTSGGAIFAPRAGLKWARGRIGGRPKALQERDVAMARALLKDGAMTIAEIAERLDVAPSTLYKYLPRP